LIDKERLGKLVH
jgi:large subunit ribosomal protein L7Ae